MNKPSGEGLSSQKVLIGIISAIVIGVCITILGNSGTPLASVASVSVASSAMAPETPQIDPGMSPMAANVEHSIEGTWQNVNDQKFQLIFEHDGVVVNRYEGNPPTIKTGIWGVFTADMAQKGETTLPAGVAYLQMTIDGENRTFQVGSVNGILQLVYLKDGSVLHLQKI